jgi:hypothetical protein
LGKVVVYHIVVFVRERRYWKRVAIRFPPGGYTEAEFVTVERGSVVLIKSGAFEDVEEVSAIVVVSIPLTAKFVSRDKPGAKGAV